MISKRLLTFCAIMVCCPALSAHNMIVKKGSFVCKTLTALNYAERMALEQPTLSEHRSTVNNKCTTIIDDTKVTAFSIGVSAKVELFELGNLKVYYVNSRDLSHKENF